MHAAVKRQGIRFVIVMSVLLLTVDNLSADKKQSSSEKSVYRITFDHQNPGKYTGKRMRVDWPGLEWEHCQRAQVVSNNGPFKPVKGNALRVSYPAEQIGSLRSGAQFRVRLKPRDEYSFSYFVRCGHGDGSHWEFSKGGKLPGLGGGKCNTGGKKSTGDGWSARYMWREKGKLILYLYHLDQKSRFGDQIALSQTLKAGHWYRLTQRIRLNTDSQANGILQVWVDGKLKLNRKDIRFREGGQAPINRCLFETFYGGSTQSWAPVRESLAYFDEIRIQPNPFDDLE